jgi:hypothetical protein
LRAGEIVAVPRNGLVDRLREIPARMPAEGFFRFVDGEVQQRHFLEMFFLMDLFPGAGPVVKDFLNKFEHRAVRVGFGYEIKRLGVTRDF